MTSDDFVGDAQYYSVLATRARGQYDQEYAIGYRASDDRGINGPTHTDLGDLLTEVCMSFGRPIAVMDLGCGTGRYFHCLKNLKSLTGVDVSPDMLSLAQHPVRESSVAVPVTLLCANVAEVCFPNETFDLIYSIGVFGQFLPVDAYFLQKVAYMLTRDGKFVFTTVDKNSPQATSWKRKAVESLLPLLPLRVKRKVKARLRSFSIREDELKSLMKGSPFFSYTIKRRYLPTGRIDFVCVANMENDIVLGS